MAECLGSLARHCGPRIYERCGPSIVSSINASFVSASTCLKMMIVL